MEGNIVAEVSNNHFRDSYTLTNSDWGVNAVSYSYVPNAYKVKKLEIAYNIIYNV